MSVKVAGSAFTNPKCTGRLKMAAAAIALSVASLPAAAQTEIELWLGGEPGTVNVFTELADAYMAENPDVTITSTFIGSDLFNPSLVPALSSGEGPDIFQFGTGPGQPAAIIGSGLVLDLTPYYFDLGWDQIIPETVVNTTSTNGKLWAVGDAVETTAMLYNKDIFAEQGLEVPTDWASMVAAVETLKEAGFDTPIGLGGADKWPISHWQSMLFGRFAGPEGVEEVMFGDGAWTDEPFVASMQALQDMAKDGYFGPNPIATGYPEVMDAFWRGEIPMTFTGPWVIDGAIENLGDEISKFSVFQVPPLADGQSIYPTEDIGSGWYVSASTENADVAADVLNFYFFRPESRIMLLESAGNVPVGPVDDLLDQADIPPLAAEMRALADRDRANGTIHAFLDTVTPGNLTNVAYDGLQAILVDRMSPEEFTAALQDAWEQAKAEDAILKPGGVAKP
ncbi:MAG: extracellular solute-binding protein [Pseudomonadota bacterium]